MGALCSMLAYILMVTRKIEAQGYIFLGSGVLAAVLIGLSLIENFNLASLIMQLFYGLVSLYGLNELRKLHGRT